jgi:phosphate:Na+ symporter
MSSEQLDVFKVLLGLGAGLTLFLYGVTRLSDGLRAIAGDRMRELLARFTNNRFAGLASGHGCDDGSGLVVGRHHHGDRDCQRRPDDLCPITRRRAGREHGTTVSSQIIALDVEEYAAVPLVLGLAIHAYGRWRGNDGLRNAGMAILVLGMVFFGLATMGDSMSPLKDFKPFIDLMASLQNPIAGVLVGALVTLLIQYSSATVAIVITLASEGWVSRATG